MSNQSEESITYVEIFSDGACLGNPGHGGWGVLLRYKQQEKTLSGNEPNTTNNRMELTGAIKGLEALKKPCAVKLYTDSQYVQKGMTEWIHGWKRKNWKDVKNVDLWLKLDELCQLHKVEWFWVKGHSGHRENEIVDKLATESARKI